MTADRRRPKALATPPTAAMASTGRFPIVGIGASAGGLEAASTLFKELASDLGAAYILVLHLDPARESAVAEILGRITRMPVVQVTDGMRVAPDRIYVIPPNYDMTIADGCSICTPGKGAGRRILPLMLS